MCRCNCRCHNWRCCCHNNNNCCWNSDSDNSEDWNSREQIYKRGYADGFRAGCNVGFNNGYIAGYTDALNQYCITSHGCGSCCNTWNRNFRSESSCECDS